MKRSILQAVFFLLSASVILSQEVANTIPPPPGKGTEASVKKEPEKRPVHERIEEIWQYPTMGGPPERPSNQPGSQADPYRFEGIKIGQFFNSYRSAKNRSDYRPEQLDQELKSILPTGVYRFQDDCVLSRAPGEKIHKSHWIISLMPRCLNIQDQREFPVTVIVDDGAFLRRFLRDTGPGRLLNVTARLRDRGVGKRGPFAVWEVLNAEFQNPYFSILGRQFPEYTESELLDPGPVSLALPGLLPIARRAAMDGDSQRVYELEMVLSRGKYYHFGKGCPLVLTDDIRRDPATTTWRFQARIQCIQDSTLSEIDIQLPEEIFRFYPELPTRKGLQFTAALKFRGILTSRNQFYLLWDTIKDIGDP